MRLLDVVHRAIKPKGYERFQCVLCRQTFLQDEGDHVGEYMNDADQYGSGVGLTVF